MTSKWFDIRIKTEPAKMKYVSNKIQGFPEEFAGKYFFQLMQSVGFSAAEVGRTYMNEPINKTKTGVKRKAAGGNGPGRVDSGDMRKGFKYSQKKSGAKSIVAELGWLSGEPGYSIFQEYGTSNGVAGMFALRYARDFFQKEMVAEMARRSGATSSGAFKQANLPTSFED